MNGAAPPTPAGTDAAGELVPDRPAGKKFETGFSRQPITKSTRAVYRRHYYANEAPH